MPSNLIELRPNRRLLDHDFEGYKLNLQALPHWSHSLAVPVDLVFPDEVQYSFIHAKLFALHNHLVADYWDHRHVLYYIDKKQQVRKVLFDSANHLFHNNVVYDVPAHVERVSGHFKLCLLFLDMNLAVISDGTGYLHIVATGGRQRSQKQIWKTLHSALVLGECKYFALIDARTQEKKDKVVLHCLLQSVERNENHFYSVLTWVTFEEYGEAWKQTSMRQLQGKGTIHYAAIETSFSAVYVASDNQFKYIFDSEKDITEAKVVDPKKIVYTWLQSTEDISLTLQLSLGYNKHLLHITVMPLSIKVSYAGTVFVEGKLRHKVDSELTTWNVQEGGQVDILLTKSESKLWEELIEGGDACGEQIFDRSMLEETHRRLAHLCSETETPPDQSVPGLSTQELEECDVASEEDTLLVRLDATNHEATHRIPLSVHQYLFSVTIDPKEVPALALRHDVDSCIWQPYTQLVNSNTWPMQHKGTLMAFGYIQSSKQNRKFVTCPPDFSYSVVCEASRHIFIYRAGFNQDCQLRQRGANLVRNVKIGQQHVFNIDKFGEVLGINAMNNYLFVLTETTLVAVEIR